MSKSRLKAKVKRQKAKETRCVHERITFYLLPFTFCLAFGACRQDMQDQPRYEAYEASKFFKDGLASRPLPEGTVPRGYLMADKQLYTGKMDQAQGGAPRAAGANNAPAQSGDETTQAGAQTANTQSAQTTANNGATAQGAATTAAQQPAGAPDDVETFPFPVTAEVLARGQERYEIFCAMCHGATGYGDGMIVRRGFRKPPSYHEDRLRQARVGHIFRVITEGYGSMPPYRAQIPVQDRWAIVAYMRALQFSQQNTRQAQPTASPAHGGNAQPGGHE